MPIFLVAAVIGDILSGSIIMKDAKHYSFNEFVVILVGGFLCLVAVWIIVSKPDFIQNNV